MRKILMTFGALVALGGTAFAGPIPTIGDTVIVTGSSHSNDTAYINYAPAGINNLQVYSGPETLHTTAFGDLLAWCTDLFHNSGPATYSVAMLTNNDQGIGTALSSLQIGQIGALIAHGSDKNIDQAALQLAIWSVEYGDAFSFSSPSNNGTKGHVTAYLTHVTNGHSADWDAVGPVMQMRSADAQGFSFIGNDPSPVPEPASMAALGVGLLGLGFVRRKKVG